MLNGNERAQSEKRQEMQTEEPEHVRDSEQENE